MNKMVGGRSNSSVHDLMIKIFENCKRFLLCPRMHQGSSHLYNQEYHGPKISHARINNYIDLLHLSIAPLPYIHTQVKYYHQLFNGFLQCFYFPSASQKCKHRHHCCRYRPTGGFFHWTPEDPVSFQAQKGGRTRLRMEAQCQILATPQQSFHIAAKLREPLRNHPALLPQQHTLLTPELSEWPRVHFCGGESWRRCPKA